jgi:hypothetical protein
MIQSGAIRSGTRERTVTTGIEGDIVGLKVGNRLRAQNSTCEVIVVKGTDAEATLLCGGVEMTLAASSSGDPATGETVALGKRYTDEESAIEVLATKAGPGPLTFDGRILTQKTATLLPASD